MQFHVEIKQQGVVAQVLREHWFSHYGVPFRIHSDQGRNFESVLIKEICALYGMKKSRTTPYHPSGNGQVERFNQTICSLLRSLTPTEKRRWPEMITHVVFMYNTDTTPGDRSYALLPHVWKGAHSTFGSNDR